MACELFKESESSFMLKAVYSGSGDRLYSQGHPGFEFYLCYYEAWSNHQVVCVSVSQLLSEDYEVSWAPRWCGGKVLQVKCLPIQGT